jgi:hypothetical protein
VSRPADGAVPSPDAVFDFDRPTGTAIRTEATAPAWADITFTKPRRLTRLRVRNATDEEARSARELRVVARTRWRRQVVYDATSRIRAWRAVYREAKARAVDDPATVGLLDVLDMTVRGEYARAHPALNSRVADDADRLWFRAAVNEALLPARGMEWTVHGPQRPFRLWSALEQVDYVEDSSAAVVAALGSLTPNVCLGFGSVLAVVRDHALIPHDDDIDIIIGFEPDEAATIADGLERIERHLRPLGFQVSGAFAAHRHVRRPGRKRVDVFVGLFEGDAVSWYPGARGGLTRAIVFPPRTAELLGVACRIPHDPETYLERLYGPGWTTPDPFFRHATAPRAHRRAGSTRRPRRTGRAEPPRAGPSPWAAPPPAGGAASRPSPSAPARPSASPPRVSGSWPSG